MGKISKNANIYDLQGNLLRHVDEDGRLHNYTTEELEELVDKLANDKDENGKVKDPRALNNANSILFQYYQKYGNPHENELKELIKKYQESKTTKEEAQQKLEELASDLDEQSNTTSEIPSSDEDTIWDTYADGNDEDGQGVLKQSNEIIMEKYVDFEEIKDMEDDGNGNICG